MEVMQWIKCSNQIPRSDGLYITWNGKYSSITPLIFGMWQVNHFTIEEITHWMPLPRNPED